MTTPPSKQAVTNFFKRVVLSRRWLTFLTLCVAFAVFGASTVNLFNMFRANVTLIADYGVMALADGAARQFVELTVTLVLAMVAYVVFKACEYRLVHQLTDFRHGAPTPDYRQDAEEDIPH